ncbi:MAG: MlaD family protein [Deltaproteobacteria bacterium]|jgi:phospholipid/cholesterol/gamma-HCH transport system substrate-binding protein|nr:MlaD family protein [Deltaproteobacteria bacterium]
METKAGYIAVGAAAILATLLFFGFILFAVNKDGANDLTYYQIEFEGGISGLSMGNEVRFNGINVGEVRGIEINKRNPSMVQVIIAVGADVPINDDAEASLEAIGITGRSVIYITGGDASGKRLTPAEGQKMASIKSKKSGLSNILQKTPALLDSADTLLRRSVDLLSPENENNLRLILASLAALSVELEQRSMELKSSIEIFNNASSSLQKLLDNGASPALEAARDSFQRLNDILEQAEPGVRRLSTSGAEEAQRALSEANVLLRNLNQLVQRINADPKRFLFGDTVPDYRMK